MRPERILFFLFAFALGSVAVASAQECPMGGCEGRPAHEGMDHEAMMARHAEMMAEMQAADARLDALVAQMNDAAGDARVDAMAALLTEMVAQRKGMCSHMREMMHGGGMMPGGAGHEGHGPPPGAPQRP
jgi:hypothetical protein